MCLFPMFLIRPFAESSPVAFHLLFLELCCKILEPNSNFFDNSGDIERWITESASTMAPTQISPITTFQNAPMTNFYGSLDLDSPPSASTFAGASAFPYFYGISDNESTVGVSKTHYISKKMHPIRKNGMFSIEARRKELTKDMGTAFSHSKKDHFPSHSRDLCISLQYSQVNNHIATMMNETSINHDATVAAVPSLLDATKNVAFNSSNNVPLNENLLLSNLVHLLNGMRMTGDPSQCSNGGPPHEQRMCGSMNAITNDCSASTIAAHTAGCMKKYNKTTVPADYMCHLCFSKDHFIRDCPQVS